MLPENEKLSFEHNLTILNAVSYHKKEHRRQYSTSASTFKNFECGKKASSSQKGALSTQV